MNTLKNTLIAISMLASATAAATPAEDIAKIRMLLPAGQDVAQVKVQLLRGASEAEALDAGKSNYVIRDLNGDGLNDVLVIAEEDPKRIDEYTIEYHKRSLQFFVGQKDGSVKLAFINDKMVRSGDEGGVMGDPLEGFYLRPNGSIVLNYYGGSAWKWGYSDVMQWRGGQLMIIGLDSMDSNPTGSLHTKSINYITGQVVETFQKMDEGPTRTKKSRVPVKPLVPVAVYTGYDM